MNHPILQSLQAFTSRDSIDLSPSAAPRPEEAAYPPLARYVLELSRHTKPETAAEGLFRAVLRDVLDLNAFSQVNINDGFVDYLLPEINGTVVIELKPLFQRYSDTELRYHRLRPKQYLRQIRKYLHQHEYVVLTDLRTAVLFSARDTLVNDEPFAELPFVELIARQLDTRSLLDTLRRTEDAVEKPELDRQFFADLKEWYRAFEKVAFTPPEDAAELIILLINKLVFAKTLEDHGLVPYRFIQDLYEHQNTLWEAKGAPSIIRSFLRNLEEFFDEYYDTELFARKIWDHLDRDPANLARFATALDLVLGVTKWDKVFSRGIVHYNYRRIDEDIFGKSYEMFLAANRKDEGIYYTPAPITTPMADSLVDSLFTPVVDEICACVHKDRCDFAAAEAGMERLFELRIADTAAGSGGFLIKVLRAVWRQYGRIDAACAWVRKVGGEFLDLPPNIQQAGEFRRKHAFDDRRVLVARLLLRHIFAIDKDGGALEVAKTNVWKEAVKLTPPDYNFRQLKSEALRILPNLELNFVCADSLVDVETARQVNHLHEYSQHALQELWQLRQAYIDDSSDHAPLDKALELREKLRVNLAEHFEQENLPEVPAFLGLFFFPCYFDTSGAPRPNGGFAGIIGNPPWEAVKPVRKEFAQRFFKDATYLGKYGLDIVEFDKWMAGMLADNTQFRNDWNSYQSDYTSYKVFLSLRFKRQGAGDVNYFKLFLENNLSLVREHGQVSNLVPSGIQTDEGCAALRHWIVESNTLAEITSFENRGYIEETEEGPKRRQVFPDVDPRYKFSIIKVSKTPCVSPAHTFDGRFYLHDPAAVFSQPIKYGVEMVKRFSPKNFSIMEFRTEHDYVLCTKIRGGYPLLGDLGYPFRRELHMTEDAHFFQKRDGRKLATGELPLYEGKMIYQFDTHRAPGTFYVIEEHVRVDLLRKELFRLTRFVRESGAEIIESIRTPKKKAELDALLATIFTSKNFQLQYEVRRLAYRKIGRSTDERTLIAALIDGQCCLGESLNYLSPFKYEITPEGRLNQSPLPVNFTESLVCLLNSFVLNYYIRNKISANVNLFYLYELPIPPLDAAQRARLALSAEILSKTPDDLKERARLEAFIGREVYGLTIDDWRHLTGTFIFGGDSDSKADLDEIIRLSLEGFDAD